MTPERWARIKTIFGAALEKPEDERATWLESACGGDGTLRAEVERLLAQDEDSLSSPAPRMLAEASAGFTAGDLLGHYRVEEKIGQGGMGAVYRAYDMRLHRRVAVKVLTSRQFADPECKQRLMREARTASALSHPNIVGIHEVGSDNGVDFIAMEFVEGKTLQELVPGKGLPLGKALDYAVQIAGGLAKAHAAGVVHRDLKPGNIMVTPDGLVKLLDFGLARRVQLEPGQDTTVTIEGEIIGTPAYMSPEQAEGKPLDARSDVFSFGLVLYQMLTGRQAFLGDSAPSILAAVLREEPPPLGPRIPRDLQKVVNRCLRKDSAHRFQHMDDVKVELDEMKAEAESGELRETKAAAPRRSRLWPWLAGVASAGLAGALAGTWLFAGPPIDVTRHRYTPVTAPSYTRSIVEGGGTGAFLPAWSPDAKSIVYSADGVRLQRLDSLESLRLSTDGLNAFFSPDGSRVFFVTSGETSRELWSVSVAGGKPERVFSNLGWHPFLDGAGVSPDGGALGIVRPVRPGESEMSLWVSSPPGAELRPYPGSPTVRNPSRAHLRFSPDGSKLMLILNPRGERVQWWLLDWPPPAAAQRRSVRRLFERGPAGMTGTSADWLSDSRHLIAAVHEEGNLGGPLWIADTVTGSWQRLTPPPLSFTGPRVSRDGRVLFHIVKVEEHAVEIPLDGSPMRPLLTGLGREQYPSWSPSSDQMVYVTDRRGEPEIWLASRKEGWQRPVVTQRDFLPHEAPRWFITPTFSPDGTRIAYTVGAGAVWVSPLAGGPPIRICEGIGGTWSPDGAWLTFLLFSPDKTTLMKVQPGRSQEAAAIRSTSGIRGARGLWLPSWSPDGRWITIQLPEGFGIISPDGANSKILYRGVLDWGAASGWSRDGSTLFLAYLTPQGRVLSSFDVRTGTERRIRDLGTLHFSYFGSYGSVLSLSPEGKSLAASTLNVRFEPWILDGLEPPRSLWGSLIHRR